MTLASIIAAWAVLWVLVAAVVMAAGLRRGRPLPAAAWLVTIAAFLAAFGLLGAVADLFEVFGIYPHGFPLGPTPADGVRGFGWPTLAAWIAIWAAGLAAAAPAALTRKRQPQQVTVPATTPSSRARGDQTVASAASAMTPPTPRRQSATPPQILQNGHSQEQAPSMTP